MSYCNFHSAWTDNITSRLVNSKGTSTNGLCVHDSWNNFQVLTRSQRALPPSTSYCLPTPPPLSYTRNRVRVTMSDPELEAIRQARLAELRASTGGMLVKY